MININEIKIKLKELGFKDESVDTIIYDVIQVILAKSFGSCLLKFPENEQSKLKKFSINEFEEYIEKNKDKLPEFSGEEFKNIYNETWKNYFDTISK
ncbi:MAG: hypothetical protein NTU81_03610 [Candidatus Nomurabacteria bacterium]|nr:hypothetical protein [Candidatus Nomurabacteria bacterium]